MKKIALCMLVVLAAAFFTSCATVQPIGAAYTELKLPVAVGNGNATATKVGRASCQSVLALVTTGDASLKAACENGGITKISFVDWEVKNILGLIGNYTLVVYGE